MLTFIVVVQGA